MLKCYAMTLFNTIKPSQRKMLKYKVLILLASGAKYKRQSMCFLVFTQSIYNTIPPFSFFILNAGY